MIKTLLFGVLILVVGGASYYLFEENATNDSQIIENREIGLVLAADGLGAIDFGSAEENTVLQLSSILGAPTRDTGWINSFSVFGTCPGNKIRVVEWNRLRVFFGDTKYGVGNFFQYNYTGRDTQSDEPQLFTEAGLTLDDSKIKLLDFYPEADVVPFVAAPGYDLFRLFSGDDYIEGTLQDDKVFWISAGVQCGD